MPHELSASHLTHDSHSRVFLSDGLVQWGYMTTLHTRNGDQHPGEGYTHENISEVREEELRVRLDDARDALDAMPESELLKLRKENAELALEVYRNEHDNTGSYKFKRFGAEVMRMFSGEDDADSLGAEMAPSRSFKIPPSMEKRRMIFIDLLELDRLNKEGGSHDVGDQGLGRAAEMVRGIASKYGDFEIFRSGGNQFMLDMKELDDKEHHRLVAQLSSLRVQVKEGLDPAPLVANGVDFKDAVEDFNLLLEKLGGLESHEAARELTGLLIRSGEWGSEIKKLAKRAMRVREILEKDAVAAKEFFDNYAKKAFSETPYKTLEDCKQLIEEGTFDETIRELAFVRAHERFGLERKRDAVTDEEAHRIARAKTVMERVSARNIRENAVSSEGGLADIPEETRGEAVLRGRREALISAKRVFDTKPTPMSDAMLERKRLELELEGARRDSGTGLLGRGVYYEDLERAITEDEPTTVIFVDMGFLKYFDKQGGRDVGNNALRLAASLMERALEDAGVDGEAYRYGGDEFTVRVKGGVEEAKAFLNSLDRLNEDAGKVPRGKSSKDDYVPTELQFSHGLADIESMKRLAAGYEGELSLNKKAELMTHIADVGVEYLKASDRFEYLLEQMRNSEFHDTKLGKKGADNPYTRQLESKITYSNKALFSELGGEMVLRIFADELRNLDKLPEGEQKGLREAIDGQIRKFVLDRVDAAREMKSENKILLDRLVEMRTRMSYLEGEIASLHVKERADSQRIKALEAEKARTERDMKELTKTRNKLSA